MPPTDRPFRGALFIQHRLVRTSPATSADSSLRWLIIGGSRGGGGAPTGYATRGGSPTTSAPHGREHLVERLLMKQLQKSTSLLLNHHHLSWLPCKIALHSEGCRVILASVPELLCKITKGSDNREITTRADAPKGCADAHPGMKVQASAQLLCT